MELVTESKIDGTFNGWNGDNYYRLINGQIWQQVHYKYKYHYAYRPDARILSDGSKFFLEVDGMDEIIEVRRAPSTNFLYNCQGNAVGFWHGKYIYAMDGSPIVPNRWFSHPQTFRRVCWRTT